MSKSFSIDPRAYSGGIVNLKAPNYAGYFQQAMAHRLAKQQALSQYYDRVQTSINPAGVRDVDMDGWQKKADDWNKFGIEHRDELVDPRRDQGRSLGQFNSMHRDLLGDLNKSKQAAQKEMLLQRIYSDPKKAQLATKNDLLLAHGLGSSIYSPDHYKEDGVTPHDLTEFSFNAPPLDINAQRAMEKSIVAGLKPTRTWGNPTQRDYAAGTEVVPYSDKHSIDNLKEIANRAGSFYDNDKRVQSAYENKVLTPDQLENLSKSYKSVFPNDDIVDESGAVDHRKVLQADEIMKNSQSNSSGILHSVPRIPVGRGQTKAQQDQQLMLNLTNQMATAMKSGNLDEVKRLGAAWGAGNGKSQYQDIDQGAIGVGNPNGMSLPENIKKGFIVRHVDKQWVPDNPANPAVGAYKDVMTTTELDPNDPALVPKLANLHQRFMGSTPALEKGVIVQTLNPPAPGTPTPAPTAVPATAPKSVDQTLDFYLKQK